LRFSRWAWAFVVVVGIVLGCRDFAWATGFTFTTIDVPGSNFTAAHGINNSNTIVGTFFGPSTSFNDFAFVTPDQGASFTTYRIPGSAQTTAQGINVAGQIVGNYGVTIGPQFQQFHGYFTTNQGATFTTIEPPGSTFSVAAGINGPSQIVGGYVIGQGNPEHGFLTSDHGSTFTTIDFPGAFQTGAFGVNGAGHIVGFYDDAGLVEHGFLKIGSTFTTLDPPGSTFTDAYGINAAGQIAGTFDNATGPHGFLTSDNGATYTTIDVTFPNSSNTQIFGINDAGYIVGSYFDHNSDLTLGFLGTPQLAAVPEPSTLPLVTSGMIPFAFAVLRRRPRG